MFHDWVKSVHSAEFRRCLIELDVDGVMKLWEHIAPHLAIMSRKEALYTLHMARTDAKSVPLHMRQYSTKWLRDRGLGSALDLMLREKRRTYHYAKK